DQKHTTIGLDVQGRLVKIRLGDETQVQHGYVQLTTCDEHGPANAHPTGIHCAGIQEPLDRRLVILDAIVPELLGSAVDGLVVNREDRVLGQECVRNIDFAAGRVYELADGGGNGSLAVSRGAVNEHGLPAHDGGADGIE